MVCSMVALEKESADGVMMSEVDQDDAEKGWWWGRVSWSWGKGSQTDYQRQLRDEGVPLQKKRDDLGGSHDVKRDGKVGLDRDDARHENDGGNEMDDHEEGPEDEGPDCVSTASDSSSMGVVDAEIGSWGGCLRCCEDPIGGRGSAHGEAVRKEVVPCHRVSV